MVVVGYEMLWLYEHENAVIYMKFGTISKLGEW